MTNGQLLFYSGVGLLILTIILGIFFFVKKPRYIPENAAYSGNDDKRTQKLRNGYPTDRLTIRREPVRSKASDTVLLPNGTERLTAAQSDPVPKTEVLRGTEVINLQRTEKLGTGTAPLSEETTPLAQSEKTLPLSAPPASISGETAVLNSAGKTGDTEKISGTTPISGV